MAKGGFRGMPGGGGMNQAAMMKQAQKMQQEMLRMQQEQEAKTFTAKAGGGMNMNMLKQAQKMQQDMMKMQQELQEKEYSATAGGGVVSATVNGKHELKNLVIEPDAVDPDDVEMLQDMIMAAVNEAMRTADTDMSSNMQKLTGGLGGLF